MSSSVSTIEGSRESETPPLEEEVEEMALRPEILGITVDPPES
jgi:hypothetical protein